MHAHFFQHVPFEGLWAIKPRLLERGFTISRTAFFDGESPPTADEVDFLIVMGGPMSVNDAHRHPWLMDEKAFLRDFIATGKPVLGICLGAQLIARALGARVFRNPEPEIGWFPLEGLPVSGGFAFPSRFDAFHWHGETFELPPDAIPLARSAACENQAFRVGERAIGLQFHLETTPASAAALVEHCAGELVDAPFVSTAEEIVGADPGRYVAAHAQLDRLLTSLLS